jgi:hypothetical protein
MKIDGLWNAAGSTLVVYLPRRFVFFDQCWHCSVLSSPFLPQRYFLT